MAPKLPGVGDLPRIKDLAALLRRGGAFLVVGVVGFLVDAGSYNALVFLGGHGHGPLFELPIVAKVIAIALATVVTYAGNRYWTFRHRPKDGATQRWVLYAVFNLIAIGLQLGCLGFSRYALGLAGPLADNVSALLIGQSLALVFRFWAYDRFVFKRAAPAEQFPQTATS